MQRFIDDYGGESFDLLVIGGGISGACVAYEAASRGLRVALVEKADFGGATSAATSKMIHGGMRYLANREFKLVRESLRERRILTNIAPNFVNPTPFIVSFYDGEDTPDWMIKLGIFLYDLLSYDKGWLRDKSKKMPVHKSLRRDELLKWVPDVNRKGLGDLNFLYYDCLSHFSERFTLAFLKSALKFGAKIANYTKLVDFTFTQAEDGKKVVQGGLVRDLIHQKDHTIKAKKTIICAGPWSDIVVNKILGNTHPKQLRRSEGVHIVTRRLPQDVVFCMSVVEGARILIIPYRNHTLVGLTDKEYLGHPDDWAVTEESIRELLAIVNKYFGDGKGITYEDIVYAYGGLRPLTDVSSEDVHQASRRYEISDLSEDGVEGVLVVEGGKWTTSRGLAENVVDQIIREPDFHGTQSRTANEYLVGCEIGNLASYVQEKQIQYKDSYSAEQIAYLVKSYGTQIDDVLALSAENKSWQEPVNSDGETLGQVVYAIRNELAYTLKDILLRRTGIGLLGYPGEAVLRKIAAVAAEELNWDETRMESEISSVSKVLKLPS